MNNNTKEPYYMLIVDYWCLEFSCLNLISLSSFVSLLSVRGQTRPLCVFSQSQAPGLPRRLPLLAEMTAQSLTVEMTRHSRLLPHLHSLLEKTPLHQLIPLTGGKRESIRNQTILLCKKENLHTLSHHKGEVLKISLGFLSLLYHNFKLRECMHSD